MIHLFPFLPAIIFGTAWLGVLAFLHFKKRTAPPDLLLLTVFFIYLFKVLDYTLFQFQSLLLLKHFVPNLRLNGLPPDQSLNLIPLLTLTAQDLKTSLLNILMLVPFGFGLPFLVRIQLGPLTLLAALFSLVIESVQYFSGRAAGLTFRIADVNDVIFNTAGAVIGYVTLIGFVRLYVRLTPTFAPLSRPFVQSIMARPQRQPTSFAAAARDRAD